VAELNGCQGTDETEQYTERQWSSDDATNQNGYKNDACNGSLDKILRIYAF
jgi:hypothetical protein